MLLLTSPASVFADEGTYLVTLKDSISLFGLHCQNERDYLVVSEEELSEYLDAGIVDEYEPNYKVELMSENWNLDAVNCDFAWEFGCYGNEVRIGVIDSGVYPFEELQSNILAGKNYLDNSSDTTDNIGHGTFVTGIIASKSKGISYKSKIVPLKCFDKGKDTYVDDLLDAIYDAVDIYDCDVINMSWGIAEDSVKLKRAITYAANHGVIMVSAVGNYYGTTVYYPAGYDMVTGVASVNQNKAYSSFSQYNNSVFVTAPGEELESLSITGFSNNSGTSFSAPHVTALAAMAKCVDSTVDAETFQRILQTTSEDLGDAGYDTRYGYGLINFQNFLLELIKSEEVFLSPINTENTKSYSVIYNNAKTEQDYYAVYADYTGNTLKNCVVIPIKLQPKEQYRFENPISKGYLKYMIWNNSFQITPKITPRELQQ